MLSSVAGSDLRFLCKIRITCVGKLAQRIGVLSCCLSVPQFGTRTCGMGIAAPPRFCCSHATWFASSCANSAAIACNHMRAEVGPMPPHFGTTAPAFVSL